MQSLRNIFRYIGDFLLLIFNKEFLIFLFFLVLSATYWVMSVLNDTMEREIVVPVRLVGVPDRCILVSDSIVDVKVMVRDKGFAIAAYLYGDEIMPVNIPFSTYARDVERCSVTNAELVKMVSMMLSKSTKVLSVKPEHLEFTYTNGNYKMVPVKIAGRVRPADSYYLTHVDFSPEQVKVFCPGNAVSDIQYVETEALDITNFSDTITRMVKLQPLAKAKVVPSEVRMTLYPDILTEATINVPITTRNVPNGAVLRVFPSQALVSYVVGASQYNTVNESQFEVVADYNTTSDGVAEKCTLKLTKSPRVARNAKVLQPKVNYLIEH